MSGASSRAPSTTTPRSGPGGDPADPTSGKLAEFRRSLSADPIARFRQIRALGESDAAASYITTGPDIAKALAVTKGAVVGTVVGAELPGSELLLRIKVAQSTPNMVAAGTDLDVSTGAGFGVRGDGTLAVLKPTGWTLASFPPGQEVMVLVRDVEGGVALPSSVGWLLVVQPDGSLRGPSIWPESRAVQRFTAADLLDLVAREHA